MLIFILTFVWIFYSLLEGFIQAHYYDMYPAGKGHTNLHPFYLICRAVVAGLIYGIVALCSDYLLSAVFVLCLAFLFSFFHNGIYYVTRNWLNPELYKKKWWDHSETSNALIELGTGFRTGMAVFGFIGIFFVYMEFKNYIL